MGYSPQGCKELDTTEQLHLLTLTSLLYKLEYQRRLTLSHKTAKTLDKIYEIVDLRRCQQAAQDSLPEQLAFDCPSFLSREASCFGAGRGS